jgi:hypothetical protein
VLKYPRVCLPASRAASVAKESKSCNGIMMGITNYK